MASFYGILIVNSLFNHIKLLYLGGNNLIMTTCKPSLICLLILAVV